MEGRARADAGNSSKRPETQYITRQTPGAGTPRLVMGARFGCSESIGGFRFGIPFDLCESRNYGFSALIF